MIAAELQRAGRSVLMLEMGAYRNEADFKQLELPGLFELYLGGGMLSSEDGSIALFAGSTRISAWTGRHRFATLALNPLGYDSPLELVEQPLLPIVDQELP